MSPATCDFDLHGVVRVRLLDAAPADVSKVAHQLGLAATEPEGQADLAIRFVEVATHGPLTYVGLGDTAFNEDGFFVLQGTGGTAGRTRIPFDELDRRPEILCERSVPAVPHLLSLINLVALSKDVLPLHASAFTLDGLNVLVTGWSKGGKTEALLAAVRRGACYVGDEWVYLTPQREMLGLPEPIRVWDWQLEQCPELLRARLPRDRARLSAWRAAATVARIAGTSRLPGAGLAGRLHPLAARQAYLQVPPRDLFGSERVILRAPLDATVLVCSHSSQDITTEFIENSEISRRMPASLAEERARFLAHYRQFCFASGDRTSPLVDAAAGREARLLAALFDDGQAALVSHPSPCDISSLGDAVLDAATRLARRRPSGPHDRDLGARDGQVSGEVHTRLPRLRVALVGADGAGKSTITRQLETAPLPAPVKRIYMGVNLESSSLMLPTTRLLLAAKRARGGRPDLVGAPTPAAGRDTQRGPGRWRAAGRSTARMAVWVLEEWLRQGVAWRYSRAGYLVVFDRHFLADHYHSDIESGPVRRGAVRRLHGWMLKNAYPKPDLVVCLDAPGSVLHARKPESSSSSLEYRRQQYLGLAGVVPAFEVIDADRPMDQVLRDVVDLIRRYCEEAAA